MKHLLDADAASNTLSWRWVAGLHTAGKSYLVRRDNIERYHHAPPVDGFSMLEQVHPLPLNEESEPEQMAYQRFPTTIPLRSTRAALLIHEEDLSVETTALRDAMPQAVGFFRRSDDSMSMPRIAWRDAAFADAATRAAEHFQQPVVSLQSVTQIINWLQQQQIQEVLMMAPMVGPLQDALVDLPSRLEQSGMQLTMLRREEDERYFPFATGGFFTFWKKASRGIGA